MEDEWEIANEKAVPGLKLDRPSRSTTHLGTTSPHTTVGRKSLDAEATMHTNTVIATLWLLAALSRLIAAAGGSMPPSSDDADVDADDDPAPAPFEDEETTTVTTITTTLTRTVTLIQVAAAASTAPDEMSIGAKEYRLQGCFARQDGVGAVLGTDFIIPAVPVASADVDVDVNTGSDMSLSLCLKLCAGTVGRGNETYPYVGVSGGEYVPLRFDYPAHWKICLLSSERRTANHKTIVFSGPATAARP